MQPDPTNALPISQELFACLIRLKASEVREFVSGLPESKRAQLALFCYARSHLRDTGLLIARECSKFALAAHGGNAGAFLASQAAGDLPAPLARGRAAVSLWSPSASAAKTDSPDQAF